MQVEGRLPLELKLDVLVDLTDLQVHALHPRQDVDQQFDAVQETLPKVVLPTFTGTLKKDKYRELLFYEIRKSQCCIL